MPLITINAADIAEYHGDGVPAEFRLYANRDFIASDGVFIERGSDSRQDFYQSFGASLIGDKIRIAAGDAYSTTDALDDDGLATYTGIVYDANGVKLATVVSSLRIPTELDPINWSQLVLYSQGRRQKRPATYLHSSAILGILSGYVTALVKAATSAFGVVKLDVEADDLANPIATGANSPLLDYPASDLGIGHVFLDSEPDDPDIPIALGANSNRIVALDVPAADPDNPIAVGVNSPRVADGVKADIEIAAGGTQHLIVEPQVKVVKDVYKHLSKSYASLGSAVVDALANPNTKYNLIVDETPTLSLDLTLPNNLILDFSLGYGLDVDTGVVVWITPPANAPGHRLFTGLGQVRYKRHPDYTGVRAVHYLDDGSGVTDIPILANQSEAMRWGPVQNNGGYVLMPIGTRYTIDHDWVLQRGDLRGSANDPNINGTVITRVAGAPSADQPALVRFLPGGRTMRIKDIVLRTELADCAVTLARGISATLSQSVDGIEFDNVTVEGGSEGYRVHNTNGDINWQCHNVRINQNCSFYDQTVACVRINSVNAGGHFDGNTRPAPGAKEYWFQGVAKTEISSNGIGVYVPQEAVQFDFLPGNVDAGADTLSVAADADLQNADKVYLTNTGGALPTGWTANQAYWWNTAGTLHNSAETAVLGTSKVPISNQGTGTHHLWSSRPLPAALALQPEARVVVDGPYSEGIIINGLNRDEGNPYLLKVTSNTPMQRAVPITINQPHSHGQIEIAANINLNVNNGFLRANSIKDVVGVEARVRIRGTEIFTHGWGQPQSQYGGFTVPVGTRHHDFRGNSVVRYADDDVAGDLHCSAGNDVPIVGMGVMVPGQIRPITAIWQREGSGALAGWWRRKNSYVGYVEAQVGVIEEGGHAIRGRALNDLTITTVSAGGVASIDLREGDFYEWPVTEDATVNITAFTAGFNQKFTLRIFATATSRTITFGTGFKTTGVLATGTDPTKRFVITFDVDGTVAVEQFRTGAL